MKTNNTVMLLIGVDIKRRLLELAIDNDTDRNKLIAVLTNDANNKIRESLHPDNIGKLLETFYE